RWHPAAPFLMGGVPVIVLDNARGRVGRSPLVGPSPDGRGARTAMREPLLRDSNIVTRTPMGGASCPARPGTCILRGMAMRPPRWLLVLPMAGGLLATAGAAVRATYRAHHVPSPSRVPQVVVAVGDSITYGLHDTETPGGWVTRLANRLNQD